MVIVIRGYSRKSGHAYDFSEKGLKKMLKKGKIFENLDKNVQNLEIFWKRAGNDTDENSSNNNWYQNRFP